MTDTQANGATAKADKKAREGRSPGFPIIDLKKALERAEQFRVAEGKHSAPVASARKAWKFGEESVIARRTIAALGYFGLFADEGAGESRKVRLTETALKILLDKQPVSPERDQLIQDVALKPALHKELWEKWNNELPSDATIETFLVRDRGFSSGGAADFMAEYKNTLAFAKLDQSVNLGDKSGQSQDSGSGSENKDPAKVGDLIQAEVDGALVFEKPVRVRAVQDHDGKPWVFVDGSESGVPMEQVEVIEKGNGLATGVAQPPRLPLPVKENEPDAPGVRKSRFALTEGDVVVSFPDNMSADSVEDLDAFWQVFIKKARREATKQ
jgi:hypothetical protein